MSNFAFIDGQNLNLSITELGWKIGWRRLRVYLEELSARTEKAAPLS